MNKFYNSDETIQTTHQDQEWFLDENWKDKLKGPQGKSYWVDSTNTRTRIDAESFTYDEKDKVWIGKPTTKDHPSSFRINVATTTSISKEEDGKNVAWDDEAQIKFIKKNSSNNKLSWKDFVKKGHLIDDTDFKNFEATIYWKRTGQWKIGNKCVGSEKPDQMTIYGRGGLHGKDWPGGCLGCCYKGSFDYKKFHKDNVSLKPGSSYFEKEYHHYEGSTGYADRILQEKSNFTFSNNDNDDLSDKWIGQKFIIYDTNEEISNGVHAVRCEIWADKNADQSIKDPTKQNWQLMNIFIDKGDKYPPKDDQRRKEMVGECDAMSETQIFAWGGPTVSFRIDCTDVQIKYASIREILPPNNKIDVPDWAK